MKSEDADRAAYVWLAAQAGVEVEDITDEIITRVGGWLGQRIPCEIRCFRVGRSTTDRGDGKCWECGSPMASAGTTHQPRKEFARATP